ncbi:hypothetical protein AOQ84DRAFT_354346 [Glonium stellatum]|uniref:Uncharacterized protein n=1 Tax=Glonium stellatum TaxID=574774 RepID=A0A8E2F2H3_9PEZI|nr:hypothetical protein AOQ84DRAFT_354346 [Glonium stellatum]
MASPSPKRRKTSPTGSVPGNLSPMRKTPTRASFLSPTKASLARFNPELLPRPTSAGSGDPRPHSRGEAIAHGQEAHAYILGNPEKVQPAPNVQIEQPESREDALQASSGAEVEREASNRQPVSKNGAASLQKGEESTVNPRAQEEEADLPLTPKEQGLRGPEDTPRRGILYSSPSKRLRRNKTSAKPSPLKPKQPSVTAYNDASLADGATGERPLAIGRGEKDKQPQAAPPPHPKEKAKKQEKERLLLQMKSLQDEVQLYERVVERSRSVSSDDPPDDIDLDELITLVNNADHSSTAVSAQQKPLPVSSLLSSFLPFSKPPLQTQAPSKSPEKPTPSHAPLHVDDPLPYLRLFTALKYASYICMPDPSSSPTASQLYQIHTINVVAPQKLFVATIVMTIDTSTQQVVDLKIPHISLWAERELGTWIREKALKKDVGAVCWALRSYWDVSVRRAECWTKCERAFDDLLQNGDQDATHAKETAQIGKRKRAQARKDIEEQDSEQEDETETEEVSGVDVGQGQERQREGSGTVKRKAPKLSRNQLQRHLGRESLICKSSDVLLQVGWRVRFDWTGEAESEVKAAAAFPGVWHEADGRNSLKKVPATFNVLVKDRGVFEATKAMVGLLFS